MTNKTFEVGKAYFHKQEKYTLLCVDDLAKYGINEDDEDRFVFVGFSHPDDTDCRPIWQAFNAASWIDVDEFEECIVKDLREGDVVLFRDGKVGILGNRNSTNYAAKDRRSGVLIPYNDYQIIAILERAQPEEKPKRLSPGTYLLPPKGVSFAVNDDQEICIEIKEWGND